MVMDKKFTLRVILVDDDGNIRRTLALSLKDLGCIVVQASSVQEAVSHLHGQDFDLILTDFRMAEASGLDLIRQAKALRPDAMIVVMTAFASYENAVEVIKEGAFDYLPKPFTNLQLKHLLEKVHTVTQLRQENQDLKRRTQRRDHFAGLTSLASRRLEEFVRKAAPTEGTVLLCGESGTGKSELAKLIHELSPRAKRPFITVYCTTLSESLLESELFGHVKGSFTGAIQDKIGKLELANGGTLFLDEIGELSPQGQTKLLRFLQERVFERIGSNKEVSVNARIIAATNRNLNEAVSQGKFREDLYYRLNILECEVPQLRQRKEDLAVLIERITFDVGAALNADHLQIPKGPIMEALLSYRWPGNIRELRNVIERLAMLSKGREMQLSDLPEALLKPRVSAKLDSQLVSLGELEKRHVREVLARTASLEQAAEILGITTVTLWRKRKEFGLA